VANAAATCANSASSIRHPPGTPFLLPRVSILDELTL